MKVCPFTGELYQGEIVETTCDGCSNHTTYEECAYGTDVLVLCDECSPKGDLPEVSTSSGTSFSLSDQHNKCSVDDEYPF